MYKDLLVQSPLLALPLVAMFLFLAVWIAASIRAMTRSRGEIDVLARLPLVEDEHERR
jgi:hypothetical protein